MYPLPWCTRDACMLFPITASRAVSQQQQGNVFGRAGSAAMSLRRQSLPMSTYTWLTKTVHTTYAKESVNDLQENTQEMTYYRL